MVRPRLGEWGESQRCGPPQFSELVLVCDKLEDHPVVKKEDGRSIPSLSSQRLCPHDYLHERENEGVRTHLVICGVTLGGSSHLSAA